MSELTTRTCPACGAPVAGPGVCGYCGARVHYVSPPPGEAAAGGGDPAETPDWVTEARGFVARRMKINAIKVVRQGTGLGLKDAKDLVESGALDDPDQLARLLR